MAAIFVYTLIFSIPVLGILYSLFVLSGLGIWILPDPDPRGEWVAEVWVTWYFGRGRTLFCQRYTTFEHAKKAATRAAKICDYKSPTHYKSSYSDGRVYYEEHEFGINWGVVHINKVDQSLLRIIPVPQIIGVE